MLASTVKFSKHNRHPPPPHTDQRSASARIGRAHTQKKQCTPHQPRLSPSRRGGLIPQDPTTGQTPTPTPVAFHSLPRPGRDQQVVLASETLEQASNNRCSTHEHPLPHTRGQTGLP